MNPIHGIMSGKLRLRDFAKPMGSRVVESITRMPQMLLPIDRPANPSFRQKIRGRIPQTHSIDREYLKQLPTGACAALGHGRVGRKLTQSIMYAPPKAIGAQSNTSIR